MPSVPSPYAGRHSPWARGRAQARTLVASRLDQRGHGLVTTVPFADPPPELVAAQDAEATSAQIAAMLAARMPGGEVREMPAGIAVRSRQVVPAQGASPRPGARVDYHWPLPSQPTRWALASFTTTGAGQPDDDITELLIGLFDAIMLTWRWQPGLII